MTNRTVQSKLETLLFSGKDENFEYFAERFEARLHLLKLRTVLLDQENLSEETDANFATLLCICKLNRYRHISVRVGPPIPETCLKACKIGNLALILRNPRHENRRFSESEGMG